MLARKVTLGLIVNFAGALVGMASMFFVARRLPAESFGMLGYAVGLTGSAAFIASMGLPMAHVRALTMGKDPAVAWGTFRRLVLVLLGIFALGSAAVFILWERTFGFVDLSLAVILATLLGVTLQQAAGYFSAGFQARQQAARLQGIGLVETLVRGVLFIVIAFAIVDPSANTRLAAVALACAYAAAAGASFLWARRQARGMVPAAASYDSAVARGYWLFALPTAFAGLMATLNANLDQVFIGYFWSSTEVGYYYAARRLSFLIAVVPSLLGALFFPIISELSARKQDVTPVARTVQRSISLFVTPMAMLFVAFAEAGIHIGLSDSYLPARRMVMGVGVNALLIAYVYTQESLLAGHGLTKRIAFATLASVTTNILLNLLLVPTSVLGIPGAGLRGEGAVLATIVATLLQWGILAQASRHLHGPIYRARDLLHLVAAVATILVFRSAPVVAAFGGIDRAWELAEAGVLAVAMYFAILWVVREFGRDEMRLARETLNPRGMASYVQGELAQR